MYSVQFFGSYSEALKKRQVYFDKKKKKKQLLFARTIKQPEAMKYLINPWITLYLGTAT